MAHPSSCHDLRWALQRCRSGRTHARRVEKGGDDRSLDGRTRASRTYIHGCLHQTSTQIRKSQADASLCLSTKKVKEVTLRVAGRGTREEGPRQSAAVQDATRKV